MKKVIWTNPDGSVSIFTQAPKSGLTLEQAISRAVPQGVAYQIIDESEIPKDRTFRGAWKERISGVEVDMPKAREIKMAQIRKKRDSDLATLDVETMRYLKNPTKLNDVEAKKQELRDMPQQLQPMIDAALTPEELNQIG